MTLPFYRGVVDSLPQGISSFVVTSDLQGREQDSITNRLVGEAVAEELKLLEELENIPKVGFVALCGDLFDYPQLHKRGGSGDVTSVWNAFARNFDFVVGVHGNHDMITPSELAKNILVLDGNIENVFGLKISGVSGIIGRADRNQRKSEQEFFSSLRKATAAKPDLLLTHQGPEGLHHDQIGHPKITEFYASQGEFVSAFGHCHWDTPLTYIGSNQVLNVDNRLYIFNLESA